MRDRRSFLSGLATLPLIGGSVALIGKPTAPAVPVTRDLLFSYGAFCWQELTDANDILNAEFGVPRMMWVNAPAGCGQAKRNAAVVLSAAGLPIRGAA